jgi:predicted small lipoprotein YifL
MKKFVSAVLVLLITACGQKGPLYLPDEGGAVVTRPGQPESAPPQGQAPDSQGTQQPQTNNDEKSESTP